MADGPTLSSYFTSFASTPDWDELCRWPPDVFALANLVLDQTEAYRFAVAPAPGRTWPPEPDWNDRVVSVAQEWRWTASDPSSDAPPAVRRSWDVVRCHLDTPLRRLRQGLEMELCEALLTLHATADEACRYLAAPAPDDARSPFERHAWVLLERQGSFSRIAPARIHITPKTHFSTRGISIRSFSRYLALNYEAVETSWWRIDPPRWSAAEPSEYRLLLLPWPLEVRASAFCPVEGPLDNMDREAFGFFEFDPRAQLDLGLVERLVAEARRTIGRIDGVVLPEDAVAADELAPLESLLAGLGVIFVIAGVRVPAEGGRMGHNLVHLGARTKDGWEHFQQAKHHRWCLDEGQIRQYHLSRRLDPSKVWWEAIDLPVRTAQLIDIGGGATIAPLVCEDLARMDEVADLLRRVGPSLVVSLLLDGPQLPQRWPCRYATVLSEEPGSAVLTLTALGMVARSRPPGVNRSRAVALWSEPGQAVRPIELAPGAHGIVIGVAVQAKTVWTADGRRHELSTPAVRLAEVHQLRASVREAAR